MEILISDGKNTRSAHAQLFAISFILMTISLSLDSFISQVRAHLYCVSFFRDDCSVHTSEVYKFKESIFYYFTNK